MVSQHPRARPDATIVIVDRNEPDVTLEAVRSVLSQEGASFEIVIVDDSSGRTPTDHPAADLVGVRVLPFAGRADRAEALNAGIAEATGQAIVLLDNDARLKPGALAALLAPLADPKVGAVTALLLLHGTDPVIVSSTGGEVTRSANRRDRDWGLPLADLDRPPGPAMAFSSSAAALRPEAVADAGGWFTPEVFMYYEDTELSFRLRRRGWEIRHAPDAVGQHRRTHSPAAGTPSSLRLHERSRLRFAIAHGTPRVVAGTVWRTFAGAWLLLLRGDAPGFRGRLRSLGHLIGHLGELTRERRALERSATLPLRKVWTDAAAD